ncbi:hypothetical protein TGVEG_244250 [Toxoplasma gondii VEG]|uniref:Uncharacterized protein n=1 Tax=Toxoplasma gondii (strain ATCC 50861 / VEG) TaxID=432359 RepID=B9QJP5_TOXGV|nr:hypothetical protein TGVEG_244250 [Toxoplasma gondii VEG]CEL73206.1 TPA: hypothetical protein BN1205_103960 [Toxoplasma gondii VEG]
MGSAASATTPCRGCTSRCPPSGSLHSEQKTVHLSRSFSLLFSLTFVFLASVLDGRWRILGHALALRAAVREDSALQAPTATAMTPLTNGQVVEMTAPTFHSVRTWCSMYQSQWQVFNQMCLNKEMSDTFKQAAAVGESALFDFREYSGLQVQSDVGVVPGTNAPVRIVNDPNSPTHAAKYIYGVICTGELNYACKKVLEANVSTETTDTIAVPTSEEVDRILEHFDRETPLEAAARAQVAEQMLEAATLNKRFSSETQENDEAAVPATSSQEKTAPTDASPDTESKPSESEQATENAVGEQKPAENADSAGADVKPASDENVLSENQDASGAPEPASAAPGDDKEAPGDAAEAANALVADDQDKQDTEISESPSQADTPDAAAGSDTESPTTNPDTTTREAAITETPDATGATTETPEATGDSTEATDATGATTETPEATGDSTEAPEATGATTETPEATGATTETPDATGATTETPDATGDSTEAPGATGVSKTSGTDTGSASAEATPAETPTESGASKTASGGDAENSAPEGAAGETSAEADGDATSTDDEAEKAASEDAPDSPATSENAEDADTSDATETPGDGEDQGASSSDDSQADDTENKEDGGAADASS